MHEEISKLREKIIAIGGKDPGDVEAAGLRPLRTESPGNKPRPSATTSPPTADDNRHPICLDESAVIGVALMETQLRSLFENTREIYQDALDKSLSCTTLLKSWLSSTEESSRMGEEKHVDGDSTPMYCVLEYPKLKLQLAILTQGNEEMRTRLDELRAAQSAFVAEFAKRSSCLRNEYDNCRVSKRDRTPSSSAIVECMSLQEQLDAALEDLRAERDKASQMRENARIVERQLQKVQTKLRDTETYIAEMETTQQQLQNSVRSLQTQLKQRDHMMEMKMKDMHRALRSGESLVMKMEKQRDGFEARWFNFVHG